MVDTLVPNNPYVGPRSIKTGEAFFGRDREIRSLSALLVAERIVLLHSPSGAGKSSLIQAGLVPRMTERFNVFPVVRVNLEAPEEVRGTAGLNRYMLSTLLSLEEGLPLEKRLPLSELATLSLDSYLEKRALPDDAPENCLLLFDQFEEILTVSPTDGPAKQAFFEQLGECLQNRRRWALFAIREDYMGGLAPYVRAIPNRLNVTFRLGLLGPDAAKVAIQQPAKNKEVDFTDEAAGKLVDDLRCIQVQQPDGSFVTEQGPDVEPVQLQVVCFNLWQSHAADDKVIDEGDLQRVGSVDQALASYYANAVHNVAESASIDERLLRQWFDEHLITSEGIRSQVLKGAEITEGLPNIVLRLLENTHLIRGETRAGKTWYELSHDRLVRPVRQDNTTWFEQNLSLLQRQSVLWNQQGRSEGLLLRGKLLEAAEAEHKKSQLTPNEKDYLLACRKAYRQQRLLRRVVSGLAILLVFSIAALAFSVWAYNQSEARRVTALGQTALAEKDPYRAIRLALQSLQLADQGETHKLLANASAALIMSGKTVSEHSPILCVAWSPDGHLASGSEDGTVVIWDLATGKPAQTLVGHPSGIHGVAWSPDGSLASGSDDGTVIIWDLVTGRPAQTLNGRPSYNSSVAWSPGGRLASASMDKIIIWDLDTGKPAQTLDGHSKNVTKLAWSPNGYLASGYGNGAIIIWDLDTRQPTQILKGHSSRIGGLAWSPDGSLASGSWDHTIIIWNLDSGQPAQILRESSDVLGVAWSPNGQLASSSSDSKVIIWDLITGQPAQILSGHSDMVLSMAWSPDGRLASSSYDGTMIIWKFVDSHPPQTISEYQSVSSVAWSPDGQLAFGASTKVIIWNLDSRKPAQTLDGNSGAITSIAWSIDGRLASGSYNGTVIIWDLTTGKPAQTLNGHSKSVTGLAWSSDGRLASGSSDGTIIIWNLATGRPAQTFAERSFWYNGLSWSPDGQLASGSSDGTVVIWNPATGRPTQTLVGPPSIVTSVAWSPDGRLASGFDHGIVIIWDLATGQPARILTVASDTNHTIFDTALSVAWSPDDRLASSTYEGAVIIWDLNTGQPASILSRHLGSVDSIAWSPDGQLASSSLGTIIVYEQQFVETTCQWALRNMSIEEWVDTFGWLYIYRPACPNLASSPVILPTWDEWDIIAAYFDTGGSFNSNLAYKPKFYFLLTTVRGRLIVLGIVLLIVATIGFLLQLVFRFIARIFKSFGRSLKRS